MDDLSETDLVHDGSDLWTYQSAGNSYEHQTLPAGKEAPKESIRSTMDPTQAAQRALAEIDPSTTVTVDRTARVAGRPAYQLVLTPTTTDSLIGSVRIAIDSATSMPLRVQIFPRTSTNDAAFEVGFTELDLTTPSAATFHFTPPAGSVDSATIKQHTRPVGPVERRRVSSGKVVTTTRGPSPAPTSTTSSEKTIGEDWTSVEVVTGSQSSLGGSLDQLAQAVPAGHLISTSLISVLIAKDGRTFIGAVSPAYLEKLAAS
jgi:hypothetical protein